MIENIIHFKRADRDLSPIRYATYIFSALILTGLLLRGKIMSAINLEGQKFGRLTVIKRNGIDKWRLALWECKCDCGNIKTVRGDSLRKDNTKSCGCLKTETQTRHGMTRTPTYLSWVNMIQRCNNPKSTHYNNYGGRGIFVSKQWLDFKNFFADMGECPFKMTIERKDNDDGYNKENCSWQPRIVQNKNQRISIRNTTGVRGTSFCKKTNKYHVRLTISGNTIFVGSFDNIEQARIAREQAEEKCW